MKFDTLLLASLLAGTGVQGVSTGLGPRNDLRTYSRRDSSSPSKSNVLQFANFGYSGRYSVVSELNNPTSDDCSCALSDTQVSFSGPNSPINEEVSVHFRGPLILSQFAVYTSPDFELGSSSSGDWSRIAYYEGSSSTAENVTFLTTAGEDSKCLGQALTYASSNGTGAASSPTVLKDNTLISSNEEYSIFSNLTCQSSGLSNDCGVYREGIPAYHGFYGTIKTFLFEFQLPAETATQTADSVNYNMPAIWLLNAQIPRTAQYSDNVNCSCWRSGCGEFDIFEVKNYTQAGELFTTIHDYQGTEYIETGIQIDGYIPRNYNSTVKGGVSFDKDGNAVVWVSDSTSFNSTISASDLNGWISSDGSAVKDTLSSASLAPASASGSKSSSKKSDGTAAAPNTFFSKLMIAIGGVFIWFL